MIKVRTGSQELDMNIDFGYIDVKVVYNRLLNTSKKKIKDSLNDAGFVIAKGTMYIIDGDLSVFNIGDVYMDNYEVKWLYVGNGEFHITGTIVERVSTEIKFIFCYDRVK